MNINKMTTAGFSIAVDPEFSDLSTIGSQKSIDNVTENIFLKGKKLNPVGSIIQRKAFGDINTNCIPTKMGVDSFGKSSQSDGGAIVKPWQNKQLQNFTSKLKSDYVIKVDDTTPSDCQPDQAIAQVLNSKDYLNLVPSTTPSECIFDVSSNIGEKDTTNENTVSMDIVIDTDISLHGDSTVSNATISFPIEGAVSTECVQSSEVQYDSMDIVQVDETISSFETEIVSLSSNEQPQPMSSTDDFPPQESSATRCMENNLELQVDESNTYEAYEQTENVKCTVVELEQSIEQSEELSNSNEEVTESVEFATANISGDLLVYDTLYDLSELICITENPIMTKTLHQAFYEDTPCLLDGSAEEIEQGLKDDHDLNLDQANISSISIHSVAELLSDRQWQDLAYELPPLEIEDDHNAEEGITDNYLFGTEESHAINMGECSLEDGEIREQLSSSLDTANEAGEEEDESNDDDADNSHSDNALLDTVVSIDDDAPMSTLSVSVIAPNDEEMEVMEQLPIEPVVEMYCLQEDACHIDQLDENIVDDISITHIGTTVEESPLSDFSSQQSVMEQYIHEVVATEEVLEIERVDDSSASLIKQLEENCSELQAEVAQCRVELEQYRLELDDSFAQSQSLEEQLIVKDQEFARLMSQLTKEKEDSMISKTQTRALSHRLAAVEKEFEESKLHNIKCISELESRNQEVVKKITAEHSMAMSFQEQTLTQLHSKQLATCQQQVADLQKLMESNQEVHLAELNKAINDTKAKVYEKVKTQFDAGNKEYQKVAAQLKECQLERDLAKRQLDQKEGLINNIQVQVTNDKQVKDSMLSKLQSMCSGVQHIVNILTSNASLVSAASNGPSPDSLLFLLTTINTITDVSKQRMEELQTMRSQRDSLKSVTETMEGSLRRLESEVIPHLQHRAQQQEDRASISEGLLNTVRVDLAEATRERDMQMTVVAKLATQNESLQQQIEGLAKEIVDSKEKLSKLHFMNVDLVNMLEKSYSTKDVNDSA